MRRRALAAALATVAIAGSTATLLDAHDLFLRPRDYVVGPSGTVDVRVLNGTFTTSESTVSSDRLLDLSLVGPGGRTHPARATWSATGRESAWRVGLGAAGTYVLGASLLPRTIRLTGTQFNGYLHEEGLPDLLAARRASGSADEPAHERYAKHVKAIVRAEGREMAPPADQDTAYRTILGYPAELVPLADPYRLHPGQRLEVLALVDGVPAVRQVVLSGGRTATGRPMAERQMRTDGAGRARVTLSQRGTWYIKFIHMVPVPPGGADSVTHESKWATLTFAVR